MRIATHPEAIKHLVEIGMAADISEHIKMVESANESLIEENARLKAEVDRLEAEPDALTAYLYADTLRREDIKTLKAHIERLTKAGDAMAAMVPAMVCCQVDAKGANDIIGAWNAAKEGKQS